MGKALKAKLRVEQALKLGATRRGPLTDEEFHKRMAIAAKRAANLGIAVVWTKTGGISIYPRDAAGAV